ncbi:tripartite tricarboxylate transporter TctB family protein [Cupriavidus basilensis]|uniref:Tripartite tricarboxylate transporter TctB family protein n=1 Tax=Cupriavidus basilensis TaxID=68895 RepID=A0ABT6AG12_9BURK|nr:tripartite tricarboxylate transporter TctB family protein [Cupriavidus basilensis]MDF3831541.1 tripartite tricarboxylate transporter TctB family protein [Cupriavidus basilensis]
MSSPSRFKKDYYGGALMTLIGLATAGAGMQYHTGTLSHMGPGFFPVAVGVLLALVGIMIAVSARNEQPAKAQPAGHGHGHGMPDLRGCVCIVLGVLAFLLLGKYGGLIPATFAIVFISALGDRSNTVKQAAVLALAMCVVAAVVFWWALQLQLPLFAWGG